MAKVKNYEILLNNGRKIITLAIVSSEGLAFQTKKLYKEINKRLEGCEVIIRETKKRLNTYSKAEYYASK